LSSQIYDWYFETALSFYNKFFDRRFISDTKIKLFLKLIYHHLFLCLIFTGKFFFSSKPTTLPYFYRKKSVQSSHYYFLFDSCFQLLSFIPFITMKDLKTLKELVASITDWKSLEKMSCKPFKPSILHLAISKDAPQLYREEELIQLKNFSKLLSSVESKPKTNNTGQRMTRKRCVIVVQFI